MPVDVRSVVRVLGIAGALAGLLGCEFGPTLPSHTPKVEGPATPGEIPQRIRRVIIPSMMKGPAPPDPGITKDQCNDMIDGGELHGPDCATDVIACGQTIRGHTRGGVNRYDTRFHEQFQCWPATRNKDSGDERVYRLEMPADTRAYVTLDTPCADLDATMIKLQTNECPKSNSLIRQCHSLPKDGTTREVMYVEWDKPSVWWIVVEGRSEEEGAFALSVQCIVRP